MNVVDLVAQSPPSATRDKFTRLRDLRDERELITLVVGNSNLHPSYIEVFYEALQDLGPQESLDLLLHSTGGQAEVPWALVSLLRDYSETLGVLVPFRAMSGATHIAIAGEELVMGPVSSLGSVDPKRSHHLLPKEDEPHSVQDLKHCLDFINRQWANSGSWGSRILTKRARESQIGEIVTSLFDHVHPLAVGALEQSYELSRLITRKVLKGRRDFSPDDERIESIEERLAGEYFSHGFFIFRDDVEQDLGLPVTRPNADVWEAMRELDLAYRNEFTRKQMPQSQNKVELEIAAFIETASVRKVLARAYVNGNPAAEDWVEA